MKRLGVWLLVIIFGVAASGCATAQPRMYAYPAPGESPEQFNRDQFECQDWARQQSGGNDPTAETASGAGIGAVIGALGGAAAGAAIGAATGSPGTGAAIGAATGGIGGAAVGGSVAYARNKDGYDRAYAACMTGRGNVVR